MDIRLYQKYLARQDLFVNAVLGISVEEFEEGYVKLRLPIRSNMVNSFGIAHGGVIFTLADTALAMAVNSFGSQSPAVNASISFLRAVQVGDVLVAESEKIHRGKSTSVFHVHVTNQEDKLIATFSGTTMNLNIDLETVMREKSEA